MNRLEIFVLILLVSFGCECGAHKTPAPVPEISERQRRVNFIRDHITVIEYPHEKCYVFQDHSYGAGYVTGGISCVSYEAFDK